MRPARKEKPVVNPAPSLSAPHPQGRSLPLGKIGVSLATLCLLIPLCSLPPLRFGYYNQFETCLIAFWFFSALVCLWTYFLGKHHPRLVSHTFRLPIVWGPLLLGMATLFLSPFHVLPFRDFTGSPHIAEGALTFIASGMMVSHFSILTRIPTYRTIIMVTAFMVGLTISALTIIGGMESPVISWRYWQWAPYFFHDFLAFIDIALAALYLSIRKNLKGKYGYDILALTLFALVTYYASNKSLGYGIVLSILSVVGIWLFPPAWKRNLLHLSFFGLSVALTLLIVFYDDVSKALPESLKSLGHLSTITSRTWLSKVTFADLTADPLSWQWVQHLLIGQGWGTFNNIAASNMFLIDQVSIFNGQDYKPSWELVHRDLLHTHNILTNYFHSVGILGVSLYLYIQYKIINSLPQKGFLIGTAFLMAYQVQLLFWFQFMITVPFTLLAFSVLFRQRTPVVWPFLLKSKTMLGFSAFLLLFASLQAAITWGYHNHQEIQPTVESVKELTTAPYVQWEAHLGAQRQVSLARRLATTLQEELQKDPQDLVAQSLKLVGHLAALPTEGNYLANNVAINILSELASKPERATYFSAETFKLWEQLAKDHIALMPYRSDILLPFFNFYQALGKEAFVLNFTKMICDQNPRDPVGLWFMGSSLLKNSSRFDEGMCMLQKAIDQGIERFMPVPPVLKSKVMTHAKLCP
ncbi:MAG: hypothetical protein K0R76_988 [Alphaproteobacteria bacterium]|jgi:hypothetical protein|nr:hypothetical protein [Alphaproteobacteria bacterium]